MANTSKPCGLAPVQYLNGSPWNGQARLYWISSSDTNAFAIGDPVDILGSADANGVSQITLMTPGLACIGAIVGIGESEGTVAMVSNPNTTVAPATKTIAYYAMVADDPSIIFKIQEATTTALTAASVNLNANLLAKANSGYVSQWVIDNTTTAATATLDLKLMGLVRTRDNAFGASAKWLVLINNHRWKGPGSLGLA